MLQASIIKFLLGARIRTIVFLMLLMLLAYQVSILLWKIYPQPQLGDNRSVNIAVQPGGGTGQQSFREKAEIISQAYLFGQAVIEATPVEIVEEAPETKLNYKLRGIYFSEAPGLAAAIVELKPNLSLHFRIDDELAENITVAGINTDHILINRYGKIERLNMEKPAVSASSSAVAVNTRISTNSAATTRLLQSYKKRYVSNPLALAKRFQAIPARKNGKNIGFRLKALRGESLLKKLNLNENDIFTRINGISLDKPFQALDALKSLTTASSVSVTILRNGNEETMEFEL